MKVKKIKNIKDNISISVHPDILNLIKIYCEENNIKKSKFIENVVREHFKNKDKNK